MGFQVLIDDSDSDSMDSSIIYTGNSRNTLSTPPSTDAQHPLELDQEDTENCGRLQRCFEQMTETCQTLRSRQEYIDCLIEEIRR